MRIVETKRTIAVLLSALSTGVMFPNTLFPQASATDFESQNKVTLTEQNTQGQMKSALLKNGNTVMVWSEVKLAGSGVSFRLMNSLTVDAESGQEVESDSNEQTQPQVLGHTDGLFSLFWLEDNNSIATQTFSADGAPVSSHTVLTAANNIEKYQLAQLNDGSRLLVWTNNEGTERQITAMRLNSDNLPQGTPLLIDSTSSSAPAELSVVPLLNDDYWIAYANQNSNGNSEITLSQFNSNNQKTVEQTLSEISIFDQRDVNGALMQDGSVMFTWVSDAEGLSEVHARRYDANGEIAEEPFVLIPAADAAIAKPQIKTLLDSSFVLTWHEGADVKAQVYNFYGQANGESFTLGNSDSVAISAFNPESFATLWREGSSDDNQINGQFFEHDPSTSSGVHEPVADAGPDILYHDRSTLYLNGSNSRDYAGGTALRYNWTLLSKPEGSNASIMASLVNPGFYPDKVGEYVFNLEVRNRANGLTHNDTVTVYSYNNRPVAEAGDDKTVHAVGATVQLNAGKSYDVDKDYLWYNWEIIQKPAISTAVLDNPKSISPRFVTDVRGTYVVQLIAKDAWQESKPDTMVVHFDNTAPVAHVSAVNQATLGDTLMFDGSKSYDNNQDPISYHWNIVDAPEGSQAQIISENITALFSPDLAGVYAFSLETNDGDLNSKAYVFTVNITEPVIEEPNQSPLADAGNNLTYTRLGAVAQLDGRNSIDPDNDELTYAWSLRSAPAESSSQLDYLNSPTPRLPIDAIGEYLVELQVFDGEAYSNIDTITINVPNIDPVARAGFDIATNPGEAFVLDGLRSTDDNLHDLSFEWQVLTQPTHGDATLSNAASSLATFTASEPGDYSVQLTVTDPLGASNTDEILMTVRNQNPVAVASAANEITLGEGALMLDGTQSYDPDGSALYYQWKIQSQPEASNTILAAATAAQSEFTPDVAGVYQVSLVVNDGLTASEEIELSIEVLAPPLSPKPEQEHNTNDETSQDSEDQSEAQKSANEYILDAINYIRALAPDAFIKTLKGTNNFNRSNSSEKLQKRRAKMAKRIQNALNILDNNQKRYNTKRIAKILVKLSQTATFSNGCLSASSPENMEADNNDQLTDCSAQFELNDYLRNAMNFLPQKNGPDAVANQTLARSYLVDALELIQQLPEEAFVRKKLGVKAFAKTNSEDAIEKRRSRLINKLESAARLHEKNQLKHRDQRTTRILKQIDGVKNHSDGCINTNAVDKNDWISDCSAQQELHSILRASVN